MSFNFLLVIISLVVIVPLVFILKAKKTKALPTLHTRLANFSSIADSEQNIDIFLNQLPNLYQQIVLDIEAQFFEINQKYQHNTLDHDSFFTAKRLFYKRLPELITAYQKLEPNYAKTHIIDAQQGLTSFDIVHQQLKSILNLFHQINQSTNQLYLQNILTNERYLQSIQHAQGFATTTAVTQPLSDNLLHTSIDRIFIVDSDYQAGQHYILSYLVSDQGFSVHFVQKIGQLVYFASITQLAIESELGNALTKLHIQADLELEALVNLLHYQLPTMLQTIQQADVTNVEQQLLPIIEQLLTLLNQMLAILDKPIAIADKLALVQNLHDDFGQFVECHFCHKA